MRARPWEVMAILAVALAGCAGQTEPATETTAAAASAAASEVTFSPEPPAPTEQAQPPSIEPCIEGSVCDGPVSGDYTSTSTGATVSFTVPDGAWLGQRDMDEVGFALFQERPEGYAGLSVISFGGDVFADACSPDQLAEIDASPPAFMDWLTAREGISAGAVTETTVGGRPALQADVTSALPAACQEPPWIWLWSLPKVGDFHLNDDETARFYAVEGTDAPIIIVIEAYPGVDWEPFLSDAMAIVDSMEIDGG